ncbi:MAG: signal peptide peptidase SppA [candidate division Zixibacteria bacterium]|nr:signal peptide peptidase SppA [candidate division Zixibacteria bacterium]
MAKKSDIIIGVIIGLSFLFFLFIILIGLSGISIEEGTSSFYSMGKKVAIIEVYGVINNSNEVIRQLKKYSKDTSIPALVLDIDSPGGGVVPSQEIYEEVSKFKKSGKKVVASLRSLGASGGYYVACAADTIIANPGTLTGSIGVIFEFPVLQELFRKIGVKFEVVKRGELKEVGTWNRSMTREERDLLQSVIDDTYDQFVEAVMEGRGLEREKILELADGRIFTGRQAKELGLVDELGDFEDAVKIAGKMGGIEGVPKTIRERPKKVTLVDILTQSFKAITNLRSNENLLPKLQYIFK